MKTTLKGKTLEVIIDTEGPVIIIGESNNLTRRKKLVTTLQEGNFDFVLELAERNIRAGADALNAAYMALSILYGLTCPIANPEKITAAVRSTDLVLGRDDFAVRFVEYFQSRQ